MARFPLDPSQFGNRWLGKVTQFKEMTAAEFDDLRGATLSERIGADTPIMYLETEDALNPDQGRSTFFTLDTRPVSKWARFITSLKENCGIVLRDYNDLIGRVLYFEEREEEMGKRGRQRVWEVTGIPSPDELAVTANRVQPEVKAEAPPPEERVEEKSDESLRELILGVADGLSRAELVKELREMGLGEDEKRITNLSNQLVAEGKLTFKGGKFSVK